MKMYRLPEASILAPYPRLKRRRSRFREKGCFSPSGYRAATEKQPFSRNRSQERSNATALICGQIKKGAPFGAPFFIAVTVNR
jgi:hypothetical protein